MSHDNWNTENIRLWVLNDEMLYLSAKSFVRRRWQDVDGTYKAWIQYMGFENESTPDGASYISNENDYQELDEMMMDLV